MTESALPALSSPRAPGHSHRFSGAAGLVVMALALSVLTGWWLELPGLRSGIAGRVAMNPLSAIAFLLVSLSLRLQLTGLPQPRYCRALSRVCAGTVVVLALLCLSRVFTSWDAELDRLLFTAQLAQADFGGRPNRMAPNTALNFLLLGGALLGLDYRTRRGWWPSGACTVVAGVFGLVAVVGYGYGSRVLYGIGEFIPMAPNTALCFVLLCVGVLWARPDRGLPALLLGRDAGAVLSRRLLPAAFLVPLLLGWLRLQGENTGLYDTAGGVAVMVTVTTLVLAALVWRCAIELHHFDLARTQAERSLRDLNEDLERRVAQRTQDLNRLNVELRHTTEELRALFAASPLAICSLTSQGRVRSWNPAAEQLFGWSSEEVIGRPLPNIPADLAAEHQTLRDRALGGEQFTNYETRRLRRDGHELDVSISTAPLHDAAGASCGLVAVYMDVRGRKALESQLRQAQKMEAIGQLAGGVAHDFNNMLTVIRASAELLLTDLDPADPGRDDAAVILDTADRAGNLTRQLLAFSRHQVLQPRVLDLNLVLAELEPMVRRVVEESISVQTCRASGLDRVQADRSQLDQVILNLVVNARDAMPTGGTLLIETANVLLDGSYPRSHLDVQPGPYVALTVTDSGCGMDAATQARIFEPFFTTKGVGQGTGLGLATVYGIVQQSGGHIWVYSEVGKGTSFKVYFPRYAGPDEVEVPRDGRAEVEAQTAGARVLLAEDDVAVRSSVRRLLERFGYEVLEAANGEEALETVSASEQRIDLVISDMMMPEMSGLELRKRLGALRPGLPVLLMSGYSEEAISRLGNHGSLEPLIEKPFTIEGLLQKVQRALRGNDG